MRSNPRARAFVCTAAFTTAPSITGTAKNGQTLTGSDGTIARGTVQSRQWLRNGVAIAGATGSAYVVQAADVGTVLSFQIVAVNNLNAASTAQATSAATAVVVA